MDRGSAWTRLLDEVTAEEDERASMLLVCGSPASGHIRVVQALRNWGGQAPVMASLDGPHRLEALQAAQEWRPSGRAGGSGAALSSRLSGSDLAAALRAAQAQRWDLLDRAAQIEADSGPGSTGAMPGSPAGILSPGPRSPGPGGAAGDVGSGLLPLIVVLTDADALDDRDGTGSASAAGTDAGQQAPGSDTASSSSQQVAGDHRSATLWTCVAGTTGSRRQAALARIRRVCIGLQAALIALPSKGSRGSGANAGAGAGAGAGAAGTVSASAAAGGMAYGDDDDDDDAAESKSDGLGGTFERSGSAGQGAGDDADSTDEDEAGGAGSERGPRKRRKRLGGVGALSGYAWTLAQEGVAPWSAGVARLWRQASAVGDAASLMLPHGFDAPDMVDDVDPAAVGGEDDGAAEGDDGAVLGAPLCDVFAGPRAEAVAAGAELPPVADEWRWQSGGAATAASGAQGDRARDGGGVAGSSFVGRVPDDTAAGIELGPLMEDEAAARAAEARAVNIHAEVVGWLTTAASKVGARSTSQAEAAEDLSLLRREAGAMAAEQLTAAESADAAAASSGAGAASARRPAAAFNFRRAISGISGAPAAAAAGSDAAVPPKAPPSASSTGRDDESSTASGAVVTGSRRPRRGSGASTGSTGKQKSGRAFFNLLRSSKT